MTWIIWDLLGVFSVFGCELQLNKKLLQEACARQKEVALLELRKELEAEAIERLRQQHEAHGVELAKEVARGNHLNAQLQIVVRHNREIEKDFQVKKMKV